MKMAAGWEPVRELGFAALRGDPCVAPRKFDSQQPSLWDFFVLMRIPGAEAPG
jgi:hypothetical protein